MGDITWEFDVNLRPMRGYSSLTFLHQAAWELSPITKPIFLYYFGDHDPSGHDIERACREGLTEMSNLNPALAVALGIGIGAADLEYGDKFFAPWHPKLWIEDYAGDIQEIRRL